MKLYALLAGSPSIAVRMVLKVVDEPYGLVVVDYSRGEHLSEEYAKLNPLKEVPVLDDGGFVIGESVAIMQYLCESYNPIDKIYPKDPKERGIVNHRLCSNMNYYYANISPYALAPIWFDIPQTEVLKKKVDMALSVFETYLETNGTKYAAGDVLTIADMALASSTIALQATEFDFSDYPLTTSWYDTLKTENPDMWDIGKDGLYAIANAVQNPPDVSRMNHPTNPMRRD